MPADLPLEQIRMHAVRAIAVMEIFAGNIPTPPGKRQRQWLQDLRVGLQSLSRDIDQAVALIDRRLAEHEDD